MSGQTPSSDLFFERVVLKLLLKNQEIRDIVLPHVTEEVFDSPPHKQLVKIIIDFVSKYGKFPTYKDIKLDIEEGALKEALDNILGIDESEYTKESLLDHVSNFMKRKLLWIEMVKWVELMKSKKGLDAVDVDKVLQAKNFSFKNNIGMDVLKDDGKSLFEDIHRKDVYVKTGYSQFDEIMAGGFYKQAMTLFVAGTNTGKTLFKCSFAKQCLERDQNVLFITLEMPENKIRDRIVCNLMDKSKAELMKMSQSELIQRYSAMKKRLKQRLIIKEYGEHELTASKLQVYLKELDEKMKFKPDIVFLDYLGLVSANVITRDANGASQLKRASEEFHAVAKKHNFALVSSMQFNRQGFKSKDPNMDDISESFATLFTADEVLLINQTSEMHASRRYNYKKVKSRTPGKGMSGNFFVDYDKMRLFEDDSTQRADERVEAEMDNMQKLIEKKAQEMEETGEFHLTPDEIVGTMGEGLGGVELDIDI